MRTLHSPGEGSPIIRYCGMCRCLYGTGEVFRNKGGHTSPTNSQTTPPGFTEVDIHQRRRQATALAYDVIFNDVMG